jgi:histidinol-phosphate aminotransferase
VLKALLPEKAQDEFLVLEARLTENLRSERLYGPTETIRAERARLFSALEALDGANPYPSQANFILLRLALGGADRVFAGLKGRGVLVKNLNGAHPLLAECLRVTVGRPEENAAFLAALAALL